MGAEVDCADIVSSIDDLIGKRMYLPMAPKREKDEQPDPSVVDKPYDKVRGYVVTRTERSLQVRKLKYNSKDVTSITFYRRSPESEWEFIGANSAFPWSFYNKFKKAALGMD